MKVRNQKGFTLIELLIVVAIIGIIAAIAVPGLLRARMSGNEAAAIGSLRAVNTGEASYSSAAAQGAYAIDIQVLGAACPGSEQPFISPDLGDAGASPILKSGYNITLETAGGAAGPNDCNNQPTESNYYGHAEPLTFSTSGTRNFGTTASGTIFFNLVDGTPVVLADMVPGGGGTAIQ